MIFYVPVNPTGKRLDAYAEPSPGLAWSHIFDICYNENDRAWATKYWHRYRPFCAWAKKQGWTIVKCKLVPVEK